MHAVLRHAAWLVPAALLATGCPKLGDLGGVGEALDPYKPRVTFKKVGLRDINWEQVDVNLVFKVENPNPLKVALAHFAYDLDLEGNDILKGKMEDGLELPAEDSATLKVPLTLTFSEMADLLTDTKGKDELDMKLSGNLGFDTPIGVVKVPYETKGEVPVLRAPKVAFKGVRIAKVDLLGNAAKLKVDLKITNKGKEKLTFENFDYTFKLKDTKVASGAVDSLGEADGDGTSTLTLPIDVTLTSLGSSLVSLVTEGGNADAELKASTNVVTPFGPVPLSIDESGKVSVEK